MPTLTLNQFYPLSPTQFLDLAEVGFSIGTASTATPEMAYFSMFPIGATLRGTGFTYDVSNRLISGTLDSILVAAGPMPPVAITALNLDVATVRQAALDELGGDNTALDDVMLGLDWTINGTMGADVHALRATDDDGVRVVFRGDDTFNLGDGDDVFAAGSGNDTMNGEFGNDSLYGGGGDDSINGGVDNDLVNGMRGDDELFGEFGNDTLVGGSGNDTLVGGLGDDFMRGGAGADHFEFTAGDGFDRIRDFDPLVDTLEIYGSSPAIVSQSARGARVDYDGGEILLVGVDADDVVIMETPLILG